MNRAVSIIGLFLAAFVFAQERVVVGSSKGWYVQKSHASLPREIPYNEVLGADKNSDLVLECGRRSLVYHCAKGCEKVHACAEVEEGGATITPLRNLSLASLFRREPAQAASTAVRGEGGPSDAVVLQTPQGVHWAPALTRVLEGRYCFRLAHLPTTSAGPFRTFTLDWDRTVEKEGIAPVPNLTPGLYAFEKGTPGANAACRLDANSTPAWVLIAPQSRFDEINKQWDEDSSKVDELEQSGAATIVLVTLNHAVLASLAEPIDGK